MIRAPMSCKKITKISFHQYKKYEELVAYLENFAKNFYKNNNNLQKDFRRSLLCKTNQLFQVSQCQLFGKIKQKNIFLKIHLHR